MFVMKYMFCFIGGIREIGYINCYGCYLEFIFYVEDEKRREGLCF